MFLVAVTLLFLAVQFGGGWFVPGTWDLLDFTRSIYDRSQRHSMPGAPPAVAAVVLAVIVFYVAGFWDYIVHRGFSHSHWFWFTHEYHHLPRQVSVLMPGILARPFAFVPTAISTLATGISLYAMLRLVGLPLWDLKPVLPALLWISIVLTASHSSYLRRRPIVHRLMRVAFLTTPQEHLLHHAKNMEGNYGNFTTLWDRIYGTYLDPGGVDLDQIELGLPYDQDFLGTLTLGRWKLPPAWRHCFQIDRYCNLDAPPRAHSVADGASGTAGDV
jgi:sterol desaturase/sphingolipid hydroxylase (fatty acid hydroxylase superfamily)